MKIKDSKKNLAHYLCKVELLFTFYILSSSLTPNPFINLPKLKTVLRSELSNPGTDISIALSF